MIETSYSSQFSIIDSHRFCADHWSFLNGYLAAVKRRHDTISHDELVSEVSLMIVGNLIAKPSELTASKIQFTKLIRKSIWRIKMRWMLENKWKVIIAGVSLKRYRELVRLGKWAEIRKIESSGLVTSELMRRAIASSVSAKQFDHDLLTELQRVLEPQVYCMLRDGYSLRAVANAMNVSHDTVWRWIRDARSRITAN